MYDKLFDGIPDYVRITIFSCVRKLTDWQAKVIKWAKGDAGLNSFSPIGDCFRLPKLARQGGVQ